MARYYRSIDWGRKQDFTAVSDVLREGSSPHWTFTVTDAWRYPLGTRFHAVIEDLLARPSPDETTLLTDASGMGDVLLEDMRRAGLRPVGVIITAGGSATQDEKDFNLWHVARNILVDTLRTRLGTSLHVRCSTDMAVLIAQEAAAMDYDMTPANHLVYEPRVGRHDDLLLSVSMACWYGAHQGEASSLPGDYTDAMTKGPGLYQSRRWGRRPPWPSW